MTDKAYIVVNEEQEREVLGRLERWGTEWGRSKSKPTDFIPSHVDHTTKLPYALLVENDQISWCDIEALYEFDDIVFDGRKEEQMSEKYVVSQEFMNKLEGWKIDYVANSGFLDTDNIGNLPPVVSRWWIYDDITDKERNNRLIAIIRWVNGEDVFEVEKPKKWVVRSKGTDSTGKYHYSILSHFSDLPSMDYYFVYEEDDATKFDTREEAESWANSHQEVIEVEA